MKFARPNLQSLDSSLGPDEKVTRRQPFAFTLIEVLLAIAIFSIVLAAIHMVFYGAVRLRNRTTEAIEQALPTEQALSIIKRDLANIVMPGGTFFGQLQTSQSYTSTSNTLNVLSPVNNTVTGQSSPAFYTASGVIQDDQPWGDVVRVSYYLAQPTNNTPGQDLIRSVTRNLLPVVQEEPETQWLMGGLQSVTFLFYDGIQWRDYWDSTSETNKLPRGIKVQLQPILAENQRVASAPIELVVPVVLQVGTNDVAQASGSSQ